MSAPIEIRRVPPQQQARNAVPHILAAALLISVHAENERDHELVTKLDEFAARLLERNPRSSDQP